MQRFNITSGMQQNKVETPAQSWREISQKILAPLDKKWFACF